VEGRTIPAYSFGAGDRPLLVLGGFHGNEQASVHVSEQFIQLLRSDPSLSSGGRVVVVPNVNPDGYERGTRKNARGVDLNRNFPTGNWKRSEPAHPSHGGPEPLSEPEARLVLNLVQELNPSVIVSIHSITRNRHCNNYDGPAQAIAARMAAENGYPATASIGYPTPGSFGTWAGREQGIPTITLELPRPAPADQCWIANRRALAVVIDCSAELVAVGK
jgi:protein MpaA